MAIENPNLVAEFFATLLHAATSAHILHLRTRSFAAHMALDSLYKDLPGLVDDLAEALQGCYAAVIEDYPAGYTPPANDPVAFVQSVYDYVEERRGIVGDESQLQNIVDEICQLLDSSLYKLRFLS